MVGFLDFLSKTYYLCVVDYNIKIKQYAFNDSFYSVSFLLREDYLEHYRRCLGTSVRRFPLNSISDYGYKKLHFWSDMSGMS